MFFKEHTKKYIQFFWDGPHVTRTLYIHMKDYNFHRVYA